MIDKNRIQQFLNKLDANYDLNVLKIHLEFGDLNYKDEDNNTLLHTLVENV